MPSKYLHELKEFPGLLRMLERETETLAGLIEKDYWIMHVLYGLTRQGFSFEMKGGISLSKGYKIINRFSYPK
jgi:predicted nucleotidyltransferase component of viral defense system